MAYTNLNDFQNAVDSAKPGETIELKPGIYDGDVKLDYRGNSPIDIIMHGVTLNSTNSGLYTLDVTGEYINLHADENILNGGRMGALGVRGHNLNLYSDLKGYITGSGIGIFVQGTNHHIEGFNVDSVQNTGLSGHGFPVNENRGYSRDFVWSPSRNWRITKCVFQNIAPIQPGDAGGGVRLIPHVKKVMVDNCLFRNIKGSGLWGDHNQKEIEFYYNTFDNIEYKAIFLEICDPEPNDTSSFVAKIAGNTFLDTIEKHSVFISASGGQNPGGIEVFGNTIFGGWGIIAGGMERTFARRFKKSEPQNWEYVVAQLENIDIHHNVIKPTTGRNHITYYDGPNSRNINIDSNYYVTGHEYVWEKPNGLIDSGIIDEVKIATGGDKMNVHGAPTQSGAYYDKNAITGPMPDVFPFPDVFSSVPVGRVELDINGLPVIDDTTDPVIDDPIITDPPVVDSGLPRCVITTDLDDSHDWDDWEALAIALTYQDYAKIEKIIIASKKQPDNFSMSAFDIVFRPAYKKAAPALRAKYGMYFPHDLDVMVASSNGEGFLNQDIDLSLYPSTKAIIDLISDDDVLDIHWWGTGGECANVAKWIEDNAPELMKNVRFISHAASEETYNNYFKDKAAAQYIEEIGQKYNNYISCGFSGKTIDGKHSYPLVKINDHGTDLGKLTHYKHTQIRTGPKTDGSDAFTFIAAYVDKFGGGEDYLDSLEWNGMSNEGKMLADFSELRPQMFPDLSERYKVIKDFDGGTGDPVIDDPVVTDPTLGEIKAQLQAGLDMAKDKIEELQNAVNVIQEGIDKL